MTPHNFHPIHTPLPPMLLEMSEVTSGAQFIGMFYQGSKATWTDGRATTTFNFYQCWQPLSSHPAISFPLARVIEDFPLSEEGYFGGFGSDDCPATHLLLLDTIEKTMAISDWKEGQQFLSDQHPPLPPSTPEQRAAERSALMALFKNLGANPTINELNRRGMFEMFFPPDANLSKQRQQMVEFLDRNLDPKIKAALGKFSF